MEKIYLCARWFYWGEYHDVRCSSTYINTKMFVWLSVCSRFSRQFRNRLGYPWHKVSFRWDSESEWDSGSESGSQRGSQSGSGSGCELESEESE